MAGARGHRGHREGAGEASWPAHCPELGSLSGQLAMMDGPAVPAQDEQPWQLAAFLAQGQTPGRLLLPGLCPPSPPHCDSCRGWAGGGGPTPVMVHGVTPRAAHPGRQALRPRAGAFWVGWGGPGAAVTTPGRWARGGVPQRLLGGARAAIIPVSDAGAKAGGVGEGVGARSRPRSPPRRRPGPACPSIPSGEEAGQSRVAP